MTWLVWILVGHRTEQYYFRSAARCLYLRQLPFLTVKLSFFCQVACLLAPYSPPKILSMYKLIVLHTSEVKWTTCGNAMKFTCAWCQKYLFFVSVISPILNFFHPQARLSQQLSYNSEWYSIQTFFTILTNITNKISSFIKHSFTFCWQNTGEV